MYRMSHQDLHGAVFPVRIEINPKPVFLRESLRIGDFVDNSLVKISVLQKKLKKLTLSYITFINFEDLSIF